MSEAKQGGIKRRDFLKIIGVTGGTAVAASSCSEPFEQIIPYVIPPEGIVPGLPYYYASTCTECPAGCGVKVKTREGRAIHIEGNELNPINKNSICARGQASLQGLYNPDRIRSPLFRNDAGVLQPLGWDKAEETLVEKINDLVKQGKSDKIVFLTNNVAGSLNTLIDQWTKSLGAKHYIYETYSYEPLKKANEICFGINKIPTYKISEAKFLLSLGADFLETWLSPTEYARQFSEMREYKDHNMGKFVHVEPRASLTAVNADRWVSIKPGTEGYLALGIVNIILHEGKSAISPDEESSIRSLVSLYNPDFVSSVTDIPKETIIELATDFINIRPSIAIGGGTASTCSNSTQTNVAINLLNYVSGNIGKTIDFSKSLTLSDANSFEEISELVDSLSNGDVELLFVYNVNPVFTLPKALDFKEALKKVPYVVSFSSFPDETANKSNMVMPDSTSLEKWGDFKPRSGVSGLIQPAMKPVFNTKDTGDVLISISGKIELLKDKFTAKNFYEYIRQQWESSFGISAAFNSPDDLWNKALEQGGVYKETQGFQVSLLSQALDLEIDLPSFQGDGDYYLMSYPSYRYYDGRGANKPWLQELPDAITTGVWDSWVEVHPDTAKKLGVKNGDFLTIESPNETLETQVFVYEGIRPDVLAIPIGLGHKAYGRYAKNKGVNPIKLLSPVTDSISGGLAWLSTKVSAKKTGKHRQFVQTQYTESQYDNNIALAVSLNELQHGEHQSEHHEEPDFYPEFQYPKYRWGMSIDLNKCTGCGACVTACYSENNIPFVGKALVAKRREMSWIRIERYFQKRTDGKGFETRFIPMLCQHCGNAPCEPVCPVYATYHNNEGLNGMVYNRCVGTRYCSNNCTYKVRRFNFFTYKWPEPLNWQLNPDVTVRSKGVMEKCTFCVQRINFGKDQAKDKGRNARDGEIHTACEQACPTNAIVFGNLKESESKVSKLSHDERGYKVLEVLNTKPSITYLKKVIRDKA